MKFEVEYVVRRRDRPRHAYTLLYAIGFSHPGRLITTLPRG